MISKYFQMLLSLFATRGRFVSIVASEPKMTLRSFEEGTRSDVVFQRFPLLDLLSNMLSGLNE